MKETRLFERTIKVPVNLYKYRHWSNVLCKGALTHNEVFFNSPNYFIRNIDEWDCNAQFKEPSYEEVYSWYCDKIASKNMYPCFEVQLLAEQCTYSFFRKVLDPSRQRRKEMNMQRNESYGILCLTESPCNKDIWDYYCNDGVTFCMGYDTEKLLHESGCHQIEKIEYIEGVPQDSNSEEFVDSFHVNFFQKNERFTYEQEYRMVKIWPSLFIPENDSKRIAVIGDDCITGVYVRRSIPDKDLNEIIECVKDRWEIKILDI